MSKLSNWFPSFRPETISYMINLSPHHDDSIKPQWVPFLGKHHRSTQEAFKSLQAVYFTIKSYVAQLTPYYSFSHHGVKLIWGVGYINFIIAGVSWGFFKDDISSWCMLHMLISMCLIYMYSYYNSPASYINCSWFTFNNYCQDCTIILALISISNIFNFL